MAKPKPVIIDGEFREVKNDAKVIDIVPQDVNSITTREGALIPRSEFARVPVPDGFQTNLSYIEKGGGEQRDIPQPGGSGIRAVMSKISDHNCHLS